MMQCSDVQQPRPNNPGKRAALSATAVLTDTASVLRRVSRELLTCAEGPGLELKRAGPFEPLLSCYF